MPDLKQRLSKVVSDTINKLSQNTCAGPCESNVSYDTDKSILLRYAAAQGSVLLKNDGTLPLAENEHLSVFGRVQVDWFYTGYGSGGDVVKPYAINLIDGLRSCKHIKLNDELCEKYIGWSNENPIDHGYWGHWPRFYPEMPLSQEQINHFACFGGVAAVVIGRSAGEDRENVLEKGSYFLTDDELSLIKKVTGAFNRCIIILNIGSVIDLSWLESFGDKIGAVLLAWQGGMESGNAIADILCAASEPDGRLSDTFAKSYKAYPSADCFADKKQTVYKEDIYVGYRWFETFDKDSVIFPFGYGLGYTDFSVSEINIDKNSNIFTVSFSVTNIGSRPGRHTVQLYTEKPCGSIGNPSRCLTGFFKTKRLAPGEVQNGCINFTMYDISHYDEQLSAYAVGGSYNFYLGDNVRDAKYIYRFFSDSKITKQLSEISAPKMQFDIYTAKEVCSARSLSKRSVKTKSTCLKNLIAEDMPADYTRTEYDGSTLDDVKSGKISIEKFVSMLTDEELEALTRGDFTMNSPLGASGNAGAFAHLSPCVQRVCLPSSQQTDQAECVFRLLHPLFR